MLHARPRHAESDQSLPLRFCPRHSRFKFRLDLPFDVELELLIGSRISLREIRDRNVSKIRIRPRHPLQDEPTRQLTKIPASWEHRDEGFAFLRTAANTGVPRVCCVRVGYHDVRPRKAPAPGVALSVDITIVGA